MLCTDLSIYVANFVHRIVIYLLKLFYLYALVAVYSYLNY